MKFKEIFQDNSVYIMTNLRGTKKYLDVSNAIILDENEEFLHLKVNSKKEIYLKRENIVIINKM